MVVVVRDLLLVGDRAVRLDAGAVLYLLFREVGVQDLHVSVGSLDELGGDEYLPIDE